MSDLIFTEEYVFSTIQGEGKYMGTACTFIRLSGCNLRCSWRNQDGSETLCDTPYSSFKPERNKKPILETVKLVNSLKHNHIVISGGEPFMQEGLVELVYELKNSGNFVTIETNGTTFLNTEADFISISPKLSSSANGKFKEMQNKNRIDLEELTKFLLRYDCQLKFVANTEDDINEIKDLIDQLCLSLVKESHKLGRPTKTNSENIANLVWLMPQGVSAAQLNDKAQWIWEVCEQEGWNFSDRLHVRIWGHKRGI